MAKRLSAKEKKYVKGYNGSVQQVEKQRAKVAKGFSVWDEESKQKPNKYGGGRTPTEEEQAAIFIHDLQRVIFGLMHMALEVSYQKTGSFPDGDAHFPRADIECGIITEKVRKESNQGSITPQDMEHWLTYTMDRSKEIMEKGWDKTQPSADTKVFPPNNG